VRRYVPELQLPDPIVAERVTLRDLLSHRSGLDRHDLAWIFNPSWTRSELVARLEHLPMKGDLRAQYQYSNFGYALAALAMERASGSTWEDGVRERVLAPAGMRRTRIYTPEDLGDVDHARPHAVVDGHAERVAFRVMPACLPVGGLLVSATDAARWLLLHLADGSVGGEQLLPAGTVAATHVLHTPWLDETTLAPEFEIDGYALGWGPGHYRRRRTIWHSGGIDGFRTDIVLFPDDNLGVLACANVMTTTLPLAALLHTADALLGEHRDTSWFEELAPRREEAQLPEASDDPMPSPSHKAHEYAGRFENRGYGALAVTAGPADELAVRLGEFDLEARHRHYDTWELRYAPLDVDFTLTFGTDATGAVSEAVLSEQDGVTVRFARER
jgi:CubicO group peptidase (beta-lactamase class C family)